MNDWFLFLDDFIYFDAGVNTHINLDISTLSHTYKTATNSLPQNQHTIKMVRANELRGKSKEDLVELLNDNRKELSELAVAKVTGGAASKIAKIKSVRKNIARILTVHNQQQKESIRKASAGSKYVSKDLRLKKTRAIRRALTKKEKSAKTAKQQKKDSHFPMRRYALKA